MLRNMIRRALAPVMASQALQQPQAASFFGQAFGAVAALALTMWLGSVPVATAQPIADRVDPLAQAVEPQVIQWRRWIHERPELSFAETNTAEYVVAQLRTIPGMEIQTGLGKTGIKAVLRGGKPGRVVALRADMDALPVEEKTDLPFRSRAKASWQGKETPVAHACGHDTHVAMLLGAAHVLAGMREELAGTVVLLFQPAEEWGGGGVLPGDKTEGGAVAMVRDGAMDNPKVDVVLGQHIGSGKPGGQIFYRAGATLASADTFAIKVQGAGGHGAFPWNAKDPITVAAQIVVLMQSIVSRHVNLSEGAAVITVGQIESGNRANVIPSEAKMAGTIRTHSNQTRATIRKSLEQMVPHVAQASGLTASIEIQDAYPVLFNSEAVIRQILPALQSAAGGDRVKPIATPLMGSEDFGAFLSSVPGAYWFLNAGPEGKEVGSVHSPTFEIDEKFMLVGVKALVHSTLAAMQAP